ncbi:MAG TPA: T9SS type A sorting domain-containing protein, partial [Methanosarcina sp.]|nr:T9SS type A sorting domain-containing protein [Methanosarcina sp.]
YAYGEDFERDRLWLYRLDNDGELMWKQSYSHSDTNIYNAEGNQLYLTDDFKYVISGLCYYPDVGNPWIQYLRPYIMKTDSSGNIEWELPWHDVNGENFYGESFKSVVDNHGTIYTSGRQIIRSGPNQGDKACLMKTDSNGHELSFSSYFLESIGGLTCTINWLPDSTLSMSYAYSDETWSGPVGVIKCDREGNILKDFQIFINIAALADGILTYDGKLLLVGAFPNPSTDIWNSNSFKLNSNLEYDSIYTAPRVYDSLCSHPILSDTIPLDCVVVGIADPSHEENPSLSAFPNPVGDLLHIKLPDQIVSAKKSSHFNITNYRSRWISSTIEIYNLSGDKVFFQEVPFAQKELLVNTGQWRKGMYLVRMVYEDNTVMTVKVIKQ